MIRIIHFLTRHTVFGPQSDPLSVPEHLVYKSRKRTTCLFPNLLSKLFFNPNFHDDSNVYLRTENIIKLEYLVVYVLGTRINAKWVMLDHGHHVRMP